MQLQPIPGLRRNPTPGGEPYTTVRTTQKINVVGKGGKIKTYTIRGIQGGAPLPTKTVKTKGGKTINVVVPTNPAKGIAKLKGGPISPARRTSPKANVPVKIPLKLKVTGGPVPKATPIVGKANPVGGGGHPVKITTPVKKANPSTGGTLAPGVPGTSIPQGAAGATSSVGASTTTSSATGTNSEANDVTIIVAVAVVGIIAILLYDRVERGGL